MGGARGEAQPNSPRIIKILAPELLSKNCPSQPSSRKVGSAQALVSRYEHDEVRPKSAVLTRLASILGVSTDELLGVSAAPHEASGSLPSRCFLRRIRLMAKLPKRDQDALLRTIDAFLTARGAAA